MLYVNIKKKIYLNKKKHALAYIAVIDSNNCVATPQNRICHTFRHYNEY
jgi:hypothetical protein